VAPDQASQYGNSASANTEVMATNGSSPGGTISGWMSDAFGGLARGELNEASATLLFKLIVPAAVAVTMIIATYFVAKLLSRLIAATVCKQVDETLGKFVGRLSFYGLMIIGTLGILSVAGISVAGAAAVLTAAGFAIGLAFQGTLSNFAAGVLLLVFRPFKVGDMVVIAGVTGKVNEIDLFTTTLDTTDNRRLVLPNNSVSGNTIENMSYHEQRRVEIVVGVAYRANMETTRDVLTTAAESLGDLIVQGENRGYQIILSNLSDHSVDWTVRVWTKREDYWKTREKLTIEVKRQLDENAIEIPYPQLQLHIDDPKTLSARPNSSQPGIPIPRMATTNSATTGERTRPRARGEQKF
jgi:small conductance mechanosensitive channel